MTPIANLATLLLWFTVAVHSLADDWPQFRGPDGQGHSSAVGLPIHWGPDEPQRWKTSIPGSGWSSPIIVQDRVVVTTAVPTIGDNGNSNNEDNGVNESAQTPRQSPEQSLRAICLDAATGQTIWTREIFRRTPTKVHEKNSHASPTPISDGRRLYVHFGPYGTAALDWDGNILWKKRMQYNAVHGGGGSPILSGNNLVLSCDGSENGFVVALDRDTGDVVWRTDRPTAASHRFSFSTPLEINVDGQRQIVSPTSHVVCSYDAESGREIWRVRYPNKWSIVPRPVYAGGLVFVCTGYQGPATLLAIHPDGKGDVTETHVAWQTDRSVPHIPSPLVVGDAIFLVSDDGLATCLDVRTGKRHWRKRLGGTFAASPVHADGVVYFQNEDGQCTVLRAGTQFEEVARNDLGERTLASMAIWDGALFIRAANHLYRIDGRLHGNPAAGR